MVHENNIDFNVTISLVCPAGSFVNANNNGACDLCPVNTYGTNTDATSCSNCPSGETTQGQTGQTLSSACGIFTINTLIPF